MAAVLIPEANPQWRWFVEEGYGRVCLDLGQLGYIKSKLNVANVLDVAEVNRHFSVSDVAVYQEIREQLEICYFWSEQEFSFVCLINALAIKQFHKLLPAKNWFFLKNEGALVADFLVCVKTPLAASEALLLNVDGESADIMLIEALDANENKRLEQFSPQRVALNRLFPAAKTNR